jgi:hypothetical protein
MDILILADDFLIAAAIIDEHKQRNLFYYISSVNLRICERSYLFYVSPH